MAAGVPAADVHAGASVRTATGPRVKRHGSTRRVLGARVRQERDQRPWSASSAARLGARAQCGQGVGPSWGHSRRGCARSSTVDLDPERRGGGLLMSISVFLLDDHEIVRRGIAQLLETEGDIEVIGEAATAAQAMARIPALRPDVRSSTCGCPTARACRCVVMCGPPSHRTSVPDPHLLPRRRGPVRRDHRRRLGLPAQTGSGRRPHRRHTNRRRWGSLLDPQATAVVLKRLRTGDEPTMPRYVSLSPQERRIPAHRRWAHQPADRCRDVPGREDRQELRVLAAAQARLRPPNRGGRVCQSCAVPITPVPADPDRGTDDHRTGTRQLSRVPPSGSGCTISSPPHSCALLEVPQAAARPDKPVPIPLSTTSIRRSSPASHRDRHRRRAAVPHHVADRLPDHGQRMHSNLGSHQRIDSADKPDRRRRSLPLPPPRPCPTISAATRRRSPSPAVCRSNMADRICRTVSSSSATDCWMRRWTTGSALRRSVLCSCRPVANNR